MRLRTVITYLCLLSLGACTRSCNEYDNASEFNNAQLPEYTETGAGTLGCRLGTQVWTVLGSHDESKFGYPWVLNVLETNFNPQPAFVWATGEMTGVRDSKVFYDTSISLIFQPLDTLGGLRLLGDSAFAYSASGHVHEGIQVRDLLTFKEYTSSSRRPVRLTVKKHDSQERTVSGVFEGYVYDYSFNDSLAITDGRFDLRYY